MNTISKLITAAALLVTGAAHAQSAGSVHAPAPQVQTPRASPSEVRAQIPEIVGAHGGDSSALPVRRARAILPAEPSVPR